jgi:hypothetical protein
MSQLSNNPPGADALGIAVQAENLFSASWRLWAEERQAFVDDMVRDGDEALRELQGCKAPFDLVGVEQTWIMARTKAYIDASMRMFASMFLQPEEAAAEAASFRLPD